MSDFMPGSPYFDERPKGLLTWPKLLKVGIPIFIALLLFGWRFGIITELLLVITLVLTILVIIRK